MRERIRYTTDYPSQQLFKMLVRHVVTVNNLRAANADPATDRISGRQPRVRVASQGPAQAECFARAAHQELPDILGGQFVIVGLARSKAIRTRVTSEIVRNTWNLDLPIKVDNRLAELHKGFRLLGGHQECLRSAIVDEEYKERQARDGWHFRHGRPEWNRLGAHHLNNAETEYQAGARVLRWINSKPAVPEDIVESGQPLVDVGFGHGLSITGGAALAIHGENPDISVVEAHQRYHLPNASAIVLGHSEEGAWEELGRILPQHTQH